MPKIFQAETPEQIEEVQKIFREYEKWLGLDLCFQGFEAELAGLPGKYAHPSGRLLLASVDKQIAGCIALRELEESICEMKRLFVREKFRSLGIGKLLVEKLIEESRIIGYKKMRLDTLPDRMGKAVKLYESYGFRKIPPYYDNPHKETIFLELKIS